MAPIFPDRRDIPVKYNFFRDHAFNFSRLPRELRNLIYHEVLRSLRPYRKSIWRREYSGNWSSRLDLPKSFNDFKVGTKDHQFRQRYAPFGIEHLLAVSPQFASELSEEAQQSGKPIALELDVRIKPSTRNPMTCGQFTIDPYMRPLITRVVLRFSESRCWNSQSLRAVVRPFLTILVPELFESMPRLTEAEVYLFAIWRNFTNPGNPASFSRYPPVRCLDLKAVEARQRYSLVACTSVPGTRAQRFVFSKERLAEWLEGCSDEVDGDAWLVGALNYSGGEWVEWLPFQ